jgi:hypothetical protein
VDVEFVQHWVAAVTAELDLELELVVGHGLVADGAWRANARPAPGAIRSASQKLAALNCCTSLRAEKFSSGSWQYFGTTAREGHAPRTEHPRQRALPHDGPVAVRALSLAPEPRAPQRLR